jgi:hypothetical protein
MSRPPALPPRRGHALAWQAAEPVPESPLFRGGTRGAPTPSAPHWVNHLPRGGKGGGSRPWPRWPPLPLRSRRPMRAPGAPLVRGGPIAAPECARHDDLAASRLPYYGTVNRVSGLLTTPPPAEGAGPGGSAGGDDVQRDRLYMPRWHTRRRVCAGKFKCGPHPASRVRSESSTSPSPCLSPPPASAPDGSGSCHDWHCWLRTAALLLRAGPIRMSCSPSARY